MKDDYILIVDDELPIREMIHTSLDMAGFQCLQAEDAKQAHQIIVDQRPALILLDWMLPWRRKWGGFMPPLKTR